MNRQEIKMTSPASVPGREAGYLGNCSLGLLSDRTTEPEPPGVGPNTLQSLVTVSVRVISLADAFPLSPPLPVCTTEKRETQRDICECAQNSTRVYSSGHDLNAVPVRGHCILIRAQESKTMYL